MVNVSLPFPNVTIPAVSTGQGEIALIIGAVLLLVAFYILYSMVKNLIVNAIAGGIGLLLFHFLMPVAFNVQIQLTPLNIVTSILGGLLGLALVLIFRFFGLS